MTASWRAEWLVAVRRPRLFLLNVLVPGTLVAAVAWGDAPAAHAATAYAVLVVFFGTFGSAIPFVRDGSTGLLERWLLTGLPPWRIVAGRLSAQTALDSVQLAPALALVVFVAPSGAGVGRLAAATIFALLLANALGAAVAAVARSVAEAALFASVAALLLLHGAGVFRSPTPGSGWALVEAASPFRPLHEALLQAAGAAGGTFSGPLVPWMLAAVGATSVVIAAPLVLGRLADAREP